MSEVAYLKLVDKNNGQAIRGGCQEKGCKDLIEVQAVEHQIQVPTHPQTGAATGETVHGPLVLTKPLDRASPLLQQCLADHHKVEGELHFYRTRDGKRAHWYTLTFDDARLVSLRTVKDLALDSGDRPDLEVLELRYRRIGWRHLEQNTEATVDWLSR